MILTYNVSLTQLKNLPGPWWIDIFNVLDKKSLTHVHAFDMYLHMNNSELYDFISFQNLQTYFQNGILKNTATVSFNGFNGSDFGYYGHLPHTVTRHLGQVLLCLALRFGQFIRYTGWLEKLCLFCQSFEIPFSFYCALLRKCRNSWQYI